MFKKKIGVLLLTGLFIASPLFQSPAQASEPSTKQTKYYTEELEHLYPDSDYANNDTMEKAQFLQHSLHLNKTYLYHEGSISSMNDIDFYRFTSSKFDGADGRFSIKLVNVKAGNDFDLYLYNQSGSLVSSSVRTNNQNEIIHMPKIAASTDYYLAVKPKQLLNEEDNMYRIVFDKSIEKGTTKRYGSPATLNSFNEAGSPNSSFDLSSLPQDAVVTGLSLEAEKGSTNAYNYVFTVSSLKGGTVNVPWNGQKVDISSYKTSQVPAKDRFFVSFNATEVPQLIGGRLIKVGVVSIKNLQLTFEYEYNRDLNY
ncbi:anti protein [Bacillus altitudinis]|uniref:anti protein n=1 Tax=Bacillus TaxID=1386 RepID=UPI000C2476A3|nr:anti protein [Bacillus altitudinis]MDN0040064.1 anti protein [Bacillus aerophilus]MCI9886290.1 anti protein [Bacillus altitudinis]MCL6796854.1 anti protein [Bacillus altitudinis]MCY7452953.1 anti protein [Bacillus altitudinis]MCY7714045.1 anti protein [Bacillus altitudinis]